MQEEDEVFMSEVRSDPPFLWEADESGPQLRRRFERSEPDASMLTGISALWTRRTQVHHGYIPRGRPPWVTVQCQKRVVKSMSEDNGRALRASDELAPTAPAACRPAENRRPTAPGPGGRRRRRS